MAVLNESAGSSSIGSSSDDHARQDEAPLAISHQVTSSANERASDDSDSIVRIDSSNQMETSTSELVHPQRTSKVSQTPSYLKDYHCYSVVESLYKPATY